MGNIHVKLYEIWTSGSGDVLKDISYMELWQPFCSVEQNHCAISVECIMRNDSVIFFLIWTSGSGANAF